MRVQDKMRRDVITVDSKTSLEAAWHLMKARGIRHLPVVEDRRLAGIVTHRDLRNAWPSPASTLAAGEVSYRLWTVPVREAMTSPVVTVAPETPFVEAARLMREKKIGALPVVEAGEPVGILTESDLLETLMSLLPEEEAALR